MSQALRAIEEPGNSASSGFIGKRVYSAVEKSYNSMESELLDS